MLKNAYGVYNDSLLTYKYLTYKKLYSYPIMYIAAGNRTASTWLRDVLACLLDGFTTYLPLKHPRAERGENYDIDRDLIEEMHNRLFVINSHTPPTLSNTKMMSDHLGRCLVTVRDIRDVIVSVCYHIKKNAKTCAFVDFGLTRELPWKTILPEEIELGKEQFIDLIIERLLPGILSISEGWVDYSLKNENVKIVRYEDSTRAPLPVIKNILKFYDIRKSDLEIQSTLKLFRPEKKDSGRQDFESGRIGGWQHHLSPEQQKRCEEMGSKFLDCMGYLNFRK